MAGPLEGIRVVDLSSMLSGPWAADILGDQGADVVKIEPPGKGDHVRSLPNRSGGLPAMFVNINRSKRSVTLNLKSADGIRTPKRLFATADVVVQNFRPGVVDRLGIGYESARAINPRLVYLSISGFGERGPYADRRDRRLGAAHQAGRAVRRPLRIVVVADPLPSLNPGHDTTVAIMEAAQERGHEVLVTTTERLRIRGNRAHAACRPLTLVPATLVDGRWSAVADWWRTDAERDVRLDDVDVVAMRVDPPFDADYLRITHLLDQVDKQRVVMVNEPTGLREATRSCSTCASPS